MSAVVKGARQGLLLSVIFSASITALILIFGKYLMGIFTDTAELVTLSMRMMRILAVGYIAMAVIQALSGIMRGAGDTVTPMWISIVQTFCLRMPLAYLLCYLTRSPEYPHGRPEMLFVSMLTAWCLGAAATTFFYRLGRWKGKGIAGSNS